jgi:hypothetical protein
MPTMRIRVRRIDGGFEGLVKIGDISIGASSDDAVSALHAASGLAHELSATMAAHPELAVLIPPQATAALKAIRIASWAAKNGRLPDVAAKLAPVAVATVKSILRNIL